jgi:hypothetical protein
MSLMQERRILRMKFVKCTCPRQIIRTVLRTSGVRYLKLNFAGGGNVCRLFDAACAFMLDFE